jgi:hypothetical protein
MKEKIIQEIENLPVVEKIETLEEICKKYSYAYLSEPTITICMSRGRYEVFWLLPGIGLAEEGSPASQEFPNRDIETFRKIQFLVEKFQEFLLGEEGIQKYKETEEDRKLVRALEHGAKMNPNTGEIIDPMTGEKI